MSLTEMTEQVLILNDRIPVRAAHSDYLWINILIIMMINWILKKAHFADLPFQPFSVQYYKYIKRCK